MHRGTYAGAVLVALAAATGERAGAQIRDSTRAPSLVRTAEVALPGFGGYADSAAVRQRYGSPRRRDIWFRQDGDSAQRWHYRARAVYLDVGGSAIALEYTRPGPRTLRGLQVGESAVRVLALYGRPVYLNFDELPASEPGDGQWRYPGRTGVLTITVTGGRVVSILMGSDLTNE